MKKKLLLALLTIGMLFPGCAGNAQPVAPENSAEINYLLYGYNVITKGLVDPSSVQLANPILDAAKVEDGYYSRVPGKQDKVTTIVSDHASTLFEQLNAKANVKYKGAVFSGSLQADYDLTRLLEAKERLVKSLLLHYEHQQYVNDRSKAKDLLTEGFGKALAKVESGKDTDIDDLFNTYGTHLIINYYLGGRLESSFRVSSKNSSEDKDLKIAAEASYGSGSGSASAEVKSKVADLKANSEWKFHSIGGDIDGTSIDTVAQGFNDWKSSLAKTYDICDIADFDASMLPIWELTDKTEIRTRLQKRFDELLADAQETNKWYDHGFVVDIVVRSNSSKDDAKKSLDPGYTFVYTNPGHTATGEGAEIIDANKDCGITSNYIYISFLLGTDKSKAIYDIDVKVSQATRTKKGIVWDSTETYGNPQPYDTNNNPKQHFNFISTNLNDDGDGDYIYLYYSNDKASDDDKPITDIRGEYRLPGSYSLPAGWQWVNTNLNSGVSADPVYIAYKTGN